MNKRQNEHDGQRRSASARNAKPPLLTGTVCRVRGACPHVTRRCCVGSDIMSVEKALGVVRPWLGRLNQTGCNRHTEDPE
jgi:hypothetical protein